MKNWKNCLRIISLFSFKWLLLGYYHKYHEIYISSSHQSVYNWFSQLVEIRGRYLELIFPSTPRSSEWIHDFSNFKRVIPCEDWAKSVEYINYTFDRFDVSEIRLCGSWEFPQLVDDLFTLCGGDGQNYSTFTCKRRQ